MRSVAGLENIFKVFDLSFRISYREASHPRCGHRPSWDVRDADSEEDFTDDAMAAGLAECHVCGATWMQGCP